MPTVKSKHKIIANVEAELLKRLRARGGLSRVELARELNLAPSTAGIYVDRLISEGFLLESEKADREFGRPPTLLAPNPQGGRFVGVDFQPGSITATAVDFSQRPLKNFRHQVHESDNLGQVLGQIEDAIANVTADDDRAVLGIGVGLPGFIDPQKGIALHYGRVKNWTNIPVADRLAQKFNTPAYIENNIRSMALAELWFGHGCGLRNFVCIGVRTGIAAGIIIDGQLLRGSDYMAGEIGAWSCPSTPEIKTLESAVSIPAICDQIARALTQGKSSSLSHHKHSLRFEDIIVAARNGDELVQQILKDAAYALGWAVSQLNLLLNPEKVVLAGPLTELGDSFIEAVNESAQRFGFKNAKHPSRVVSSTLGEFNGALGAAALALHQWKPTR